MRFPEFISGPTGAGFIFGMISGPFYRQKAEREKMKRSRDTLQSCENKERGPKEMREKKGKDCSSGHRAVNWLLNFSFSTSNVHFFIISLPSTSFCYFN